MRYPSPNKTNETKTLPKTRLAGMIEWRGKAILNLARTTFPSKKLVVKKIRFASMFFYCSSLSRTILNLSFPSRINVRDKLQRESRNVIPESSSGQALNLLASLPASPSLGGSRSGFQNLYRFRIKPEMTM